MAKHLAFVEQWVLNMLVKGKHALKFETDNCVYYAIGGIYDMPKVYDKPKVTLTRQAAADMLRRHTLEGHSNIDNMINFYVEAGMLEVVEENKHKPLIFGRNFDYAQAELLKIGYKITKIGD